MEKKTEKKMKDQLNYVVYYRVSTQRQGKSGLGLKGQKNAVEAFIKGDNRGVVLAEFKEVESGKKNDRPVLEDAIAKVKEAGAILLVAKLDRLSRDLYFISKLRKDGIEFQACDMPDANKLTINIMAAMAEQEREMISQRTKAALKVAKNRGKKLGASNKKVKRALKDRGWVKSIETRKEKARVFAESLRDKIEDLHFKQGKSLQGIVDHFNEYKLAAPRGGKWSKSQLYAIVKTLGLEW